MVRGASVATKMQRVSNQICVADPQTEDGQVQSGQSLTLLAGAFVFANSDDIFPACSKAHPDPFRENGDAKEQLPPPLAVNTALQTPCHGYLRCACMKTCINRRC